MGRHAAISGLLGWWSYGVLMDTYDFDEYRTESITNITLSNIANDFGYTLLIAGIGDIYCCSVPFRMQIKVR